MAVKCGAVVMYEVEDGVCRITRKVKRRIPVKDYLALQGRFRHLLHDDEAVAGIQAGVDRQFEDLVARAG